MDTQNLLEFVFDPSKVTPFLVGLTTGIPVIVWYHKKVIDDLRSDAALLRADIARLQQERSHLKEQVEKYATRYEDAHAKYEAEKEKARISEGTIRCRICGGGMVMMRQYEHRNQSGSYQRVKIECTECAFTADFTLSEIQSLMMVSNRK